MGDVELKAREGSSLNLEFVFQPRLYRCSCGESFRAVHPVVLGLYALTGAYFAVVGFMDRATDGGIAAMLLGVSVIAYFVYELVRLARYPRVQ